MEAALWRIPIPKSLGRDEPAEDQKKKVSTQDENPDNGSREWSVLEKA
jgi:hypothetical protein